MMMTMTTMTRMTRMTTMTTMTIVQGDWRFLQRFHVEHWQR